MYKVPFLMTAHVKGWVFSWPMYNACFLKMHLYKAGFLISWLMYSASFLMMGPMYKAYFQKIRHMFKAGFLMTANV